MKPSFLDISSPEELQKIVRKRIFENSIFFPTFEPFYAEISEKCQFFWPKRSQISVKSENIKNPLPDNFLYSPGLLKSKKLGFMGQNWGTR